MLTTILHLALFASAMTRNDPQMCDMRAREAYDRVYYDCLGGGSQAQCGTYTEHGEFACREHRDCNWSYTSESCFDKTGQRCDYYTPHGEFACRESRICNWSYVSDKCYDL